MDAAAELRDVFFTYVRRTRGTARNDSATDGDSPQGPDAREGPVLDELDLDIPADTFTVVMGPSGGGKSTFLYTLNGLIPNHIRGQFSGDVTVLGHRTSDTKISRLARQVGLVMQDYEAQLFGTNVEQEVAFGPENIAIPPEAIGPRIDGALALVGLADLSRNRSPAHLSGGQKQRLVFASVLAMHPQLLLLDEPTTDLDPKGAQDTIEIIRTLSTDPAAADPPDGVTGPDYSPDSIVLVTHTVDHALLADHVVLLNQGRVYREGSPREVLTDTDALGEARVEVPPMVETFKRVGIPKGDWPLTVEEAVDVVDAYDLDWTPPAIEDDPLPAPPADVGQAIGDPVLDVTGLVHEYRTDRETVTAVDAIDLTIREGEIVAVVGHNGSGKTTLAKHLNGLLEPDRGAVRWRGTDVTDLSMSEISRHVGYVFQNPDYQIFESTVRKEVEFGPKNFGLTGDELDRSVTEAIETVELGPLEESDPFNLSKGQRQRVALASVLATDPETLVIDEPTTGLDVYQKRRFMDLLARLNRDDNRTIIMITHDMSIVARYASRTVVLRDGRIVDEGPTRTVFASDRLDHWMLSPPQSVALSNRLAAAAGSDGALPALSVDELVEGLSGEIPTPEEAP